MTVTMSTAEEAIALFDGLNGVERGGLSMMTMFKIKTGTPREPQTNTMRIMAFTDKCFGGIL